MANRTAGAPLDWARIGIAGVLAGLCAQIALAGPVAGKTGPFDPQRVSWTRLEFSAQKLFLSAQASLAVALRPRDAISAGIVTPPMGKAVPMPETLAEIRYGASGMGRNSDTTLWLDLASGAALQRLQLDSGARTRQRIYRYTDIGAWHQTRWPANDRERELPLEQWTDRSEGLRPYPAAATGLVITDPAALLWLIAATDLAKPGDRLEINTFSRRRVHRVSVEALGMTQTSIKFEAQDARGIWQREGRMPALRIRIRGEPLEQQADSDDEFELLGLQGDIELLLDPASRAPLALSGRAKILGQVTFQLCKAMLR